MLDPDEPVSIGAMVGPEAFMEVRYLMHAKQMQALDAIPEVAADFAAAFGRESGGLLRSYRSEDAETVVVALGSVLGTIDDVIDELRDEGVSIGALGIKCFRPWPSDEVRAALAHAKRVIVVEKAFAVGAGGIVGQNVRLALSGLTPVVYDVVAGLGGRAITKKSLRGLFEQGCADELGRLTFLGPRHRARRARARAHGRRPALGPARGEHAARHRRGRGGAGLMPFQPIKFYQAGSYVAGNRLLDPEQRSVQSDTERSNTLTSGHRACQGCGEALGARYALDAAMRATKGKLIAANATGCLEVFSTPFPETLLAAAVDPLAVRQRARRLDRDRRGAQGQGARGHPRARPGRRRRHRRHRLRLPVGDVRAQRRRALHLLRQRGLHEHRRAALGRDAARRAHDHHAGRRRRSPATCSGRARAPR